MTPQSAWVRNVRGRTGPACLLIASIIGGVPAGAGAGLSPAQRCSIAKDKAAAKKIASKLKCREKAVTLGAPVDPACVAIAESKFDAAIARAEAFGGCATNGDGATIESAVDSCVDSIATLAFGTTSTTVASATTTTTSTTMPADPVCCAISPSNQVPFSSCTMASGHCTAGTMQPGVCRNDGSCGAPTGPGPCCDTDIIGCIVLNASATLNQNGCLGVFFGSFSSSAVCTPAGCQ